MPHIAVAFYRERLVAYNIDADCGHGCFAPGSRTCGRHPAAGSAHHRQWGRPKGEQNGENMPSKKKLLVIGAGDFQLALVKRASQMCDVLLAAPIISASFEPYIKDALYCDVRDFDRILEFAQGANHFECPVDGVITDETDIPVLTVARIAQAMDLPGIDPDIARLFTNKALMRTRMEELGIKVLPHKTVRTLDEAIAVFEEIGTTVIIKPLDAQGSRGVKRCDTAEEIAEYFTEAARWSTSHRVIVEQCAKGREFVVEGLALDYEFKNLCIGDTVYFQSVDSLSAKERTFPTVVNDELRDRVLELNRQIVTGFGLKQGITHSEFVMDGDDIFLIETAARGGGAFISSDLIPGSCGLVSEDLLVRLALGEVKTYDDLRQLHVLDHIDDGDEPALHPLQHCGYLAFYIPVGVVESVRGVQEVLALPYVGNTQIEHLESLVGAEYVTGHSDKTSRFLVTFSGDTRAQLEERMAYIRSTIQMDVRQPDGTLTGLIWE